MGKNSSGSTSRQAASWRQSMVSTPSRLPTASGRVRYAQLSVACEAFHELWHAFPVIPKFSGLALMPGRTRIGKGSAEPDSGGGKGVIRTDNTQGAPAPGITTSLSTSGRGAQGATANRSPNSMSDRSHFALAASVRHERPSSNLHATFGRPSVSVLAITPRREARAARTEIQWPRFPPGIRRPPETRSAVPNGPTAIQPRARPARPALAAAGA
jgi:hypothetical protein